ncbi:MAG: hypothetical protein EOP88_09865 [Verrucomicrobiaceae bacterium]|jgi:hypothetical protein|nr:MAG: hypothetical protein EOP88_09865 [Verrucomicrobiaceae bacterium]
MKTIASFTTPEDAHLFRAFLGSRGIQAHLLDEYFVQLFWHYSNTIGGVRVAVEEEDAETAAAIHQEYMASLREGPYPLQPVRAWPTVILVSLLVGVPMILFGRRQQIRQELVTD